MSDQSIRATVEGGTVMGVVGARTVVIENFYAGAAPARAAEPSIDTAAADCPYPGLAYFVPEDQGIFFGRRAAIDRLAESVQGHAFTALVGASGSGKSSVVLAGLAPRLAQTGGWRFSHFRIGLEADKNPFLALARALVPLFAGDLGQTQRLQEVGSLATRLASGELALANVLGECRLRNAGRRLLLIADQFEEVFTLVPDEAARHRFIDLLLAGFAAPAAGVVPSVCLVLTLRADFYGMAVRHRALSDALQGHVENLGPMTRDELRDAIVRPAGKVGFEPGLVDTLLDDVSTRPGNLPLLQFALREMWFRQQRGMITHEAYQAIGRVEGALAQRAQEIFDSLTRKGRDDQVVGVFRRLFTRLVTLGEGAVDTRRVVDRDELGDEAWSLAQRLAGEDNRLVVTGAAEPGNETAEVVHEALIQNWPTLTVWVDRDRSFQTWLRQLNPLVEEWHRNPDDDGTLLRGGRLAVGMEWLNQRRDEMSQLEVAFLDASIRARDERRRQEDEVRQAELRQQQELAKTTRQLAEEQRARAEMAEQLAAQEAAKAEGSAEQARRQRRKSQIAIAGAIASLLFGGVALWLSYAGWVEARPWARLVGLSTGRTFNLDQDVAFVGRPAQGVEGLHQVPLRISRRVSRLHASIERSGRINDWRSVYGTTVDGEPLMYSQGRMLDHGSLITVAGIEVFRYERIVWQPWQFFCTWISGASCAGASPAPALPPETWAVLVDGRRRVLHPITTPEAYVSLGESGFRLTPQPVEGAMLAVRRHDSSDLAFDGIRLGDGNLAFVLVEHERDCSGIQTPVPTVELLQENSPVRSRLRVGEYVSRQVPLPAGERVFMFYSPDGLFQSIGQATFSLANELMNESFQILPVSPVDVHASIEESQDCKEPFDSLLRAAFPR